MFILFIKTHDFDDCLMKVEIIILTIYYKKKENYHTKSFPQAAQIHKLENVVSRLPSELEFGGETFLWGTARKVLLYIFTCFQTILLRIYFMQTF